MKTFKTVDGRRVAWKDEKQIEEQEMVRMLAFVAPLLMTVIFAFAGGILT